MLNDVTVVCSNCSDKNKTSVWWDSFRRDGWRWRI